MRAYTLTHLADATLLGNLKSLVARGFEKTAHVLAHIGEVDSRRLYAPAGYPSMFAYCVGELHFSEEAAFKRIHAARAARRFPALFDAVADARLHLSAVVLLAPHLTEANAEELLAAATHRTKSEIERLLAERRLQTVLSPTAVAVGLPVPALASDLAVEHAPGRVNLTTSQHAPGRVESASEATQHERFALPAIGRSTYDKLRYAQELLSHTLPSGDVVQVLDRALVALIAGLERRKFAATSKPRTATRRVSTASKRHIPAQVKREVWERDHGQCTFVSDTGHRCQARKFLEFDHIEPVARGGESTVRGLRLRCRAHNQYEAERVFGAGFMQDKRDAARSAAASPERDENALDVVTGLRSLGFRVDEARRAAEHAATLRGATLEDRMRAALRFTGRKFSP